MKPALTPRQWAALCRRVEAGEEGVIRKAAAHFQLSDQQAAQLAVLEAFGPWGTQVLYAMERLHLTPQPPKTPRP